MFRTINGDAPSPRLRNIAAVTELHDRLAAIYESTQYRNLSFTPQLPGTKTILPLTSYQMMEQGGKEQHNRKRLNHRIYCQRDDGRKDTW